MVDHLTVPANAPGQRARNNGRRPSGSGARAGAGPAVLADEANANDGIAGMSAMRGLMLYGAVLTFAGIYVYFMVVISTSKSGVKPAFDATLISAAAALSGVLGSAFALKIGITPHPSAVNKELAAHAARADAARAQGRKVSVLAVRIRRVLSLEPSSVNAKSWPLTFGISAYAAVASGVFTVYILNQNETPGAVKALAVTFGGYVIALIHLAYGASQRGGG